MRIYKLYFLSLFLLFALHNSAFSVNNKTRVSELQEKCELQRSLSQYKNLETSSADLIDEARKIHNENAVAYAYFYNGLAKLFLGQVEKSQEMLDSADEISVQVKNDSVRALVLNARGIYHALVKNNDFVAQQFFFKSLELAKNAGHEDLLYRVRGNLLTLSHSMNDSISYENAKEVYNYGKKRKSNEHISMGAYYLATYNYKQDKYDEAEKYIKIALDTYNKYPYEDIASVYSLYAKMLLSKGDDVKAEEMVKKAILLAQKYKQTSMEVDAYITYAEVFVKKKQYREANDMIKKAMGTADKIGMTNKVADCNQMLATNYIVMGDMKNAMVCLQKANELLRNQSAVNMERISHEQQVMHDIEQKEMESKLKQEQITAQRLVLIILTVAIIVLLVLLVLIIILYRRRQMLYKSIVLQNSRYVEHQKYLEEQLAQQTKFAEVTTEDSIDKKDDATKGHEKEGFVMDNAKVDVLYNELCRLMSQERLFTESQLTREKMAERLGTNRTYLTKVIKEKTDMSYLQFINSYRINEAIRILSDKEQISYPLKQIWSDLGFSSPSTFYKQFQQVVGITPSTYRKQFLEVNSQPVDDEDEEEG